MNKYLEKMWLTLCNFLTVILGKIINFGLSVCNYINQSANDYINNAALEINNPEIDFFERFYYNYVIFSYWIITRIKKLIVNLFTIFKYEYTIQKIHIYESLFGSKKFLLSTPNLFSAVLQSIPTNSTILDFGCGSGICYKNNDIVIFILKSNLKISGIDINKSALSKFQDRLDKSSLSSSVTLQFGDILTLELGKFDYVIFSESAPILSQSDLQKIVLYIKNNLLNKNGKIIFINNLVENPQRITKILKPKLKYITTIDFGRTLTKEDFNSLGLASNMDVKYELLESMTLDEISKFHNINFIYKVLNKLGLKNYDVTQYKITLESN